MEQVLRTVSALNEAGFTGKLFPFLLCPFTFFDVENLYSYCVLYSSFGHLFRSIHSFFAHDTSRLKTNQPTADHSSYFRPYFLEITMYETLLRPIEVFQIPPLPNIAVVSEKIKISEQKREEKRLRQIAANKAAASGAGGSTTSVVNAKRKREDAAEDLDDEDDDEMSAVEGLIASKKKLRTDIGDGEEEDEMEDDASPLPEEPAQTDSDVLKNEGSDPSPQPATTTSHRAPKNASSLTHPSAKINVSKALPEVRGHTSYLTFACLIPIPAPAVSQEDSKTEAVENP